MKPFKPMLATLIQEPFDSSEWFFEPKWDGYRVTAHISQNNVDLWSRNLKSLNGHFPEIAQELKNIKKDLVLDGEIVALGNDGRPDFNLLQNYKDEKKGLLIYYIFDLLAIGEKSLFSLPLEERKELLKRELPEDLPQVKLCQMIDSAGVIYFEVSKKYGLEGIVAKKKKSKYFPGTRSKEWLKIKTSNFQDVVVGGYTDSLSAHQYFGSLLIGIYREDKFIYIGKVGSGFDQELSKKLKNTMIPLAQNRSSFVNLPHEKSTHWIKPKIVIEIKFAEWTRDGIARQPVFQKIKDDIDPKTVSIE